MKNLIHIKWLAIGVLGAFLLELFSFISFFIPSVSNVIALLITVLFIIVTWRYIFWGVYLLFIELALGGHGYMMSLSLFGENFAIRHIWFVLLITIFLIKSLQEKGLFIKQPKYTKTLYAIFFIIAFAVLIGFVQGNSPADIFFDVNAYAFLLIAWPLAKLFKSQHRYISLINILFGALLILSLKTLITLFIFSYDLSIVPAWYVWIRDLRFGEITFVGLTFYRVFLQSQIFLILALFIIISYVAVQKFSTRNHTFKRQEAKWLIMLSSFYIAALIISFSRSFWMGVTLGGLSWLILLYKKEWLARRNLFWLVKQVVIPFVLAVIIVMLFQAGLWNPALLFDRASQFSGEPAVVTRWTLWSSMWQEITKAPVFGKGFGSRISYLSSDPRIIDMSGGTGEYSTFSFEWGFLDIWFKMGLVGLIVWLYFILRIINGTLVQFKRNADDYLSLAFTGALISLVVIHFFTPYLNHPLGISFLLLALPLINLATLHEQIEDNHS